ncbi:pentatricopeptide repeat-containing protein [Tanacetum coccineum]
MDLPDEQDEQVLMTEIDAKMCHETGTLDKNVGDDVPIYVPSRMSIYADNVGDTCVVHNVGGNNEVVDNEDKQDEVQRAIDEQNIKSSSKGNGIVIRENADPSYGNECDSDSDSETYQEKGFYRSDESDSEESLKPYDYLSDGEDEVIQLRKRMYEFKSGGEEAEEQVDKTERYPLYDEATHWKLKKPKLGEKFVTVEQFKECLTYYALANRFSLWYDRSSTDQVIAKCGQRKEVIKDPSKGLRSLIMLISRLLWLHVLRNIDMVLWIKIISVVFTPNQCRRVKDYALSEGECSLQDHYGMLWSYAKAILDSNEGSTVKVGATVNPDEKTYFDRFYKPNSGEILTVVGRDGNNQIYHVAWAIVNVKNKENWCWFLSLLGKDLEFPDGSGLTLISDQHKHTKDQQRFWHVIPAGNSKFEVRKVACIFKLNKLVEPYVPSCFNTETFGLAYNQFMKPVEGITFLPDCSNLSKILGHIPKKMPGRPKKKRIRAGHENKSSTKIFRAEIPMTCQNCGEPGHNKKGCKNPTIPKPPKEKGKAGRPKKIVPTEKNEVHDDDTPKFVNTSISEFDKAPSKNFVVFNDGKRVNLGTNWNKNKRGGKSASSYFVKMRGGKSSRGGLLLAERLGKIDKWLVVDGASSDTIDDTRALQSSHVATKSNQNDAGIIIGTQQSQVVGGVARMKGNAIEAQSPNSSPSTPIGVKMSRGKQTKTRYITNTSSSPPTARQIMSELAAQHSPKNQVTPATQEAPQLRRRQQAQVLPQREKTQRILLRKIILIRDEQRHRKNDDDDILNDDDVARVQRLKKELASKTVEIKCHRSKLGDGSNLHFFVLAVTEPSMGQTGFPNNPLSGIFEVD